MNRVLAGGLLLALAGPSFAQPKKVDATDRALAPWVTRVSELAAEDQIAAIEAKLPELNPDYRGQKLSAVIKDGAVRELKAPGVYLRDIRPFKPLTKLERLEIHGEPARPSKIDDLSALRGMPLQALSIQHTAVRDLSPLKGMPLTELWCRFTPVRDISVLKDMPLQSLSIPGGIPSAQVDQLKDKVWKRFIGENLGLNKKRMTALFARAELQSFQDFGDMALDSLEPLRGMPLTSVVVPGSRVDSLAPLAGAEKLGHLEMSGSRVADLSPIRGLNIARVEMNGSTLLKDLSPIAESKALTRLAITRTAVADFNRVSTLVNLDYLDAASLKTVPSLKPLANLKKLKMLSILGTIPKDDDYSPIANLPLVTVHIDMNPKVVAILKKIPTLENVNGQPAATALK